MSNFDLEKKAKLVTDLLLTKGVKDVPVMRCAAALDISASMSRNISTNRLQMALSQLMGPAMRFDDNGELDIFKFDNSCEYVGTCSPKNYTTYVRDHHIKARGGTSYAPIVHAAQEFFFAKKKTLFGFGGGKVDSTPVLMMVITDGEPQDRSAAYRALHNAQDTNIYYHFVGVGGARRDFPTIAYLADELPNVGEVYLPHFDMSDDEVYEQLICDELVEFVNKFSGAVAV